MIYDSTMTPSTEKNRIDFTIASTDQMTTCVFNYLETGDLSIPVPRPAYGGIVIGK